MDNKNTNNGSMGIEVALGAIAEAIRSPDSNGIPVTAQLDTINVSHTNAKIFTGWGQILGNGTTAMTKAITFPTAVTNVLSVQIDLIGYKSAVGVASSITDFDTSIGQAFSVSPYAITTTGFTAYFNGTVSFGARYHGFSWTVIAV